MTIIPRWFQICFLVLVGAGLLYVVVTHLFLGTDVEDIYKIEQSEIAGMALSSLSRPSNNVEVPVGEWTAIRSLLKNSSRAVFAGWKGESWMNYCTLTIRTKTSDFPFMLELKTRPSMDGKIVFQLSRGNKSSRWVYGSYTGNQILEYLRESFPSTCDS